jgi:hypothetical protein
MGYVKCTILHLPTHHFDVDGLSPVCRESKTLLKWSLELCNYAICDCGLDEQTPEHILKDCMLSVDRPKGSLA